MTNRPITEQHSSINKKELQKQRHINNILMIVLLCLCLLVVASTIINIIRVSRVQTGGGSEESMSTNTERTMKNDLYEIGNNPTETEKKYFQMLTDAINAKDDAAIAEAVVYNFVSDYFTWTNKDGNYEVGGLQYIFTDKINVMDYWSRYNFYKDLDLYISQDGRKNLIEVKEITTDKPTTKSPDFEYIFFPDNDTRELLYYPTYEVNVSWTYASNGADTTNFPTGARFFVVDNNGRMEIVEFYDYESIREWEEEQGANSDDDE